ncbi:Resuscitation-promoting factor RpfC [Mycobacterium simulans]|uniref:Resuscitation-promoting factor RpfC n=2 Tax=Mycobacterium simulans TaxID=627089 RepID=A0A7Z7IKV4_9MYCO|nr:Resuscitation-promoting factor RpfC [Mycobacterium simulans]SON63061.1 Resuscitation-promoting factor RpfC [Mycobacterium simulans]
MPDMTNIAKPLIKSAMAAGFIATGLSLSTGVADADVMNWEAVAECESGGDWRANTGNGAYGGLQFKQATWEEYGGVGNPANASKQEQIAVANRVLAGQGPAAWPKCASAGGLPPVPVVLPKPVRQLEQTVLGILGIFTPKQ